ncbi:MAG: response regulator transcription factor [Actinomycetota bacterium]|nr:response regulator transcription factor [Actinomycetota bacterium]
MDTTVSPRARILVVEDDTTVAEVVGRYLAREGFEVDLVCDGLDAVEHAAGAPPDLVILDLMLPGIGGYEVLRRLRAMAPLPIVILTARGEEDDRVRGLRTGADDYVTKPFSPRELTARVHALLRRTRRHNSPAEEPSELRAGSLRVDPHARLAWRDDQPIALTPLEFDLLVFLMRQPGRAFSREQLFERVWGYTFGDLSTITVHVRRLREKIEDDPSHPRRLRTVWGVGYRFDP